MFFENSNTMIFENLNAMICYVMFFCVYIFYLMPRYKIEDEFFKPHEYSNRQGLQHCVFATSVAYYTTREIEQMDML